MTIKGKIKRVVEAVYGADVQERRTYCAHCHTCVTIPSRHRHAPRGRWIYVPSTVARSGYAWGKLVRRAAATARAEGAA